MSEQELLFAYDSMPVTEKQKDDIGEIRVAFSELTKKLESLESGKDGRMFSIMRTKLEEASMWMIKSVTHFKAPYFRGS